jgi:putative toxin-antitoxin system antitoxin component (TIGR02293 family)
MSPTSQRSPLPATITKLLEDMLARHREASDALRLAIPERSAMCFALESFRAIDNLSIWGAASNVHRELQTVVEAHEQALRRFAGHSTSLVSSGAVLPELYLLLQAIPSSAPELLAREYDVSLKVVADWLDVAPKTLARRGNAALLPRKESEIAVRYGRVFEQAREAFGSDEAARDWLTTAQPSLGRAVPIDLLRSELGARQVERVLELIDYGEYL